MKPEDLRDWELKQALDTAHSAILSEYACLKKVGAQTTNVVKAIGILIKNGQYPWLGECIPDWQRSLIEDYKAREQHRRIKELDSHDPAAAGRASGAKRKTAAIKELLQLLSDYSHAHPTRSKELPPVNAHTLARWDAARKQIPADQLSRFIRNRTAQIIRMNA